MNHYTIYGLHVASTLHLPELCEGDSGSSDVIIRQGTIPLAQDRPQERVAAWGTGQDFYIHVPGIARFRVQRGREILVDAAGIDEASLRLFLLGSAFGALLHQRGITPIHGSAVATPSGAIIFCGPQGHGKSTLAAAFGQRGNPLLSDDVCALHMDADGVWLLPAIPRYNLLPDAVAHLQISPVTVAPALSISGKHPVPPPTFAHTAQPLIALYQLEPAPVERIELRLLHGYAQLTALMGNTYRVQFVREMGLEAPHFAALQQIARQTRMVQVTRPQQGYRLEELISAIQDDFKKEKSQ
ncbi:MAG: hypothetical protein KF893_13320 [Caldilineaceae bacterium]|nr:hypothetical protein [Caldilineaceae bacterium]